MERFDKSRGGARAPGYACKAGKHFAENSQRDEKDGNENGVAIHGAGELQQPEPAPHQRPPCHATHVLQC